MSYGGLDLASDEAVPHLGGSITLGDPFTWCPAAWDYVIRRFGLRSAMDLGSGYGNAAQYFHARGLQVVAIEGLRPSVVGSCFPATLHDLTQGPVFTRVDFVHCQEVVEHIDEAFLDNLLASLLCGKIVMMTHALPDQAGYHHVNLQPEEYWISHMERRNAVLLEEDTRRVRELATRDQAPYLARSGLVFANRDRI